MRFESILPGLLALSAMMFTAPNAVSQQTRTLHSGSTSVALSSTFTGALGSLDVTPGTIFPTQIEQGIVRFPVTAGAIDLDTASGNILHSGGLTLTAGDTEVRLQSFIIDTTSGKPMITGLVVVNRAMIGRLPLFDLTLPAGFSLPLRTAQRRLVLSGVGVTLDPQAAVALNAVFKLNGAFYGGFPIGTANVVARTIGW
jgi:hypothetical protein